MGLSHWPCTIFVRLSPTDPYLAKRRTANHPCPVCGKHYVNEGSLRKHLACHPETSQLTTSLRMWPCSVCQAVFTHEAGKLKNKKWKQFTKNTSTDTLHWHSPLPLPLKPPPWATHNIKSARKYPQLNPSFFRKLEASLLICCCLGPTILFIRPKECVLYTIRSLDSDNCEEIYNDTASAIYVHEHAT